MSYGLSGVRGWLEAGVTQHRSGNVEQAVRSYRQALLLGPDDPDALNLLGTGLLQLGQVQESIGYLEQAARKQRNNPMLLGNLAQAYAAANRHTDAYETFRKANRINPHELQFRLGMATTLALLGRFSDAEIILKQLTARFPDSPLVWFNLGNALRDQKRPDEAIDVYRRALRIDPQFTDAINNLGSVYQSTLRFGEAETQYRACLAIAPDHLQALYNLASVVMDLGRFVEAEKISSELIARAPNAGEAHSIMGASVGHQGRLIEALQCYERAAQLDPKNSKALETYAAALTETGRPAAGLRWFSRALAAHPQTGAPRQMLGVALLAQGCLQDGWWHYQGRPAAVRFREKYPQLDLVSSLPAELSGKHICVLREQGLGDEIFFLRYAEGLVTRGARVTYRSSSKLAPLLSKLEWIDNLVEDVSDLPKADANILVGDLPHALGEGPSSALPAPIASETSHGVSDFARHIAVFSPAIPPSLALQPSRDRVAELRERLRAVGPPPYVGLTWRAGTAPEDQNSATWLLYKSVELEALAATLGDLGGSLLALQRNPTAGEVATLASVAGRPVHDFTALNEQLEDMVALLSLLDDYVSVSNTNVHLRAAVGRTARILVPTPPEWRWMQSGRSSPWFPGFSIYRQSLQGDWTAAFTELKRDLQLNYGQGAYSKTS